MRVSEMLTGVRAAMDIKLYGDDLKVLEEKSKQIQALVNLVPGAVDIFCAQLSGQIYLQIEIRPLAVVVIGGLFTSTLLTLILLHTAGTGGYFA